LIFEQPDDRRGLRFGIARRHQDARLAVGDHFRHAASRGRDDRPGARHGVEQGRAEPLGDRAHREDVEGLVHREDVGAETGEEHVLLEVLLLDLALERGAQLPFAGDDESRVGHLLDDDRGGIDQMALPLVRDERGDVADDRRVVRQPELGVQVDRRRGGDVREIDAFVDGDGVRRRHAVGDDHVANRVGRADEAVHLPVLPARKGVPLHVEVDAARRDQRWLGQLGAHRQPERRHRHGVRIVGVDDVGFELLDQARQPPRG
jgi:hypothetical protein